MTRTKAPFPPAVVRLPALLMACALGVVACSGRHVDQSGGEAGMPSPNSDPAHTVQSDSRGEPQPCTADGDPNDRCLSVEPFQPDEATVLQLDRIFETDQPDLELEGYGNGHPSIVIDGIPYSQYWQLDDPSQYVLHPMMVGRYVFNNADSPTINETTDALFERVASELPNDGGTAFYYPNRYPLSRMSGPDYMYSAISQSELLAGFMRVDQLQKTPESSAQLAEVLDALFFPYEEGGSTCRALPSWNSHCSGRIRKSSSTAGCTV